MNILTTTTTLTATKLDANTIQISWPSGYAGCLLQGSTNLTNGAWTPTATNPPNNQINITSTNAAQFLRLISQ